MKKENKPTYITRTIYIFTLSTDFTLLVHLKKEFLNLAKLEYKLVNSDSMYFEINIIFIIT